MTTARVLVIFLSVSMMLGGPLAWGEGKKVALVVGVREYQHSKLDNLEYPSKDALELAAVLNEAGFTKVVVMHSEQSEETMRPTYENLTREIKAILKGIGKDDVLLIALSGHGVENNQRENFFCAIDANPFSFEQCVALRDLLTNMHQSGVGSGLLLVDACRDEAKLPRGAKGASGDSIIQVPEGVAALFSCASNQQAFESKEAGGGHGIFFHAVIEGLTGRAADVEGDVTWDNLVSHVKKTVPSRVRQWVGERTFQTPHSVGSQVGAVILAKHTSLRPDSPRREEMRRPSSDRSSNSKSITSKTTGAKLLLIPAGEFMMGSSESEAETAYQELKSTSTGEVKREWFTAETPAHRVKITKPFYLGETELTRGAFRKFVEATGYQTEAEKDGKGGLGVEKSSDGSESLKQLSKFSWRDCGFSQDDTHPVVNVSWNDAVAFTEWLSSVDGRAYRLPTEAEWEYACRAGLSGRYSFGEDGGQLSHYGNVPDASHQRGGWTMVFGLGKQISSDDGSVFTSWVKRYRPNGFGLYDMHGNVWEWCSDRYGEEYYHNSPAEDPPGPSEGSDRVNRGGCWRCGAVFARSAYRSGNSSGDRSDNQGFRLASSSE